ncbi:MAG TPA: nitrate reductase molybdenum cofactor assembly chaperone [Noviherbaspirillum sp.]|uniref:nitrate reductase molybdenum cofactor assembly chaperone n=1 Tax=Noviherbaspirillum sp. TaxID=1926288 RepID=UPI002D436A22|nr:nitrate reductase molybdenum cofactor assembly chaperone [Noviherbaspirillum sp.]HYD95805.1 nitrate reductase molybdenum cofactor assembly chaperone [Noviherbaspirillum sp.]
MQHFQVLSILLSYPTPELKAGLGELESALDNQPQVKATLRPLFDYLASEDQFAIEEKYVATFDRNPSHSLHLFEHIHGESRDRGQAMVDLMEEYKRHGLEMQSDELPDYVPLFLEFLSQLDEAEAGRLLSDAVHVLAHVGRKLKANDSPYAVVFDVIEALSPVAAEELTEPPIRDMDELLETYGPGADGVEPLLNKGLSCGSNGVQPVNFVPRKRAAAAAAG